jgi:hypothetical protein
VNDAPLRKRLIEAGRERAPRFADPARMAEEYWRLFGRALAARAGRDGTLPA